MIDAGFGPRETRARLRGLDLELADINALFITHGHGDHVKGARQIAGSLGIRTWATEETQQFTKSFTHLKNHVAFVAGESIKVGGLTVRSQKTPHDEPGSVCYVVDDGDEAFAIVTDLGWACPKVGAALHGVDSLMVEFNHDLHMLQSGPYTAHLKRRIGSRFGHVSNEDGAALLKMAASTALSRVLCAHLSEVNNTPDKALDQARAVVDGRDVDVAVAPQHAATPWLRVRKRSVTRVRPRIVDDDEAATAVRSETPAAPTPSFAPAFAAPVAPRASQTKTKTVTAVPTPARPISWQRQMALFASTKKKDRS